MELVPLDPEVSELGGDSAGGRQAESPQGRGGLAAGRCSLAGAREGASALRSPASSPAPPPMPCVREWTFLPSPEEAPYPGERILCWALGSDPASPPHTWDLYPEPSEVPSLGQTDLGRDAGMSWIPRDEGHGSPLPCAPCQLLDVSQRPYPKGSLASPLTLEGFPS